MFVRYGQFKADLAQQNPTNAGFFPLSGSKRYGMSVAADTVWVMSNKTTLNVRGSFYNMTDDFYNPSLLLGQERPRELLVPQLVLVAVQQRLRILPGPRRGAHGHRQHQPPGPPGPGMVPAPESLVGIGPHELVRRPAQHEGGRRRPLQLRQSRALRADQPGVQCHADGQQLRQPGHRELGEPVGGLPAGRPRREFLGAPGAAADAEPDGLFGLLPG